MNPLYKAVEGDDCSHFDYSKDGVDDDDKFSLENQMPRYRLNEFVTDLERRKDENPEYEKLLSCFYVCGERLPYSYDYRDYVPSNLLDLYITTFDSFHDDAYALAEQRYIKELDNPRYWKFEYPDSSGWGLTEVIALFCEFNKGIPNQITMDLFLKMMYTKAQLKSKQTCLEKWEMMCVSGMFRPMGENAALVERKEILKWLKEHHGDVMVLREDGTATTVRKMYREDA